MIRKRLMQLIMTAVIIISAVFSGSVSAEGQSSTMTVSLAGTSAEIAGTTSAPYVQIVVIKPQTGFETITAENFNEIVYYTDTISVTDGSFSCKILVPETAENGRYRVKGIFNEASGCEEVTASFYKTTEEYTQKLTAAYLGANAAEFPGVFSEYSGVYTETDLFAKEIETLLTEDEKGISESFVMAKDGFVNHTFTDTPETVTTASDITNMLKTALLVYHMNHSDDFKEAIAQYRQYAPLLFDETYNETEFAYLFPEVRKTDAPKTDKAFQTAVKKTLGLSLILDGSNADKAEALTKYPEALGVSEKTLENSGHALLEIVKYIKTDLSSVKSYAGGMEKTVKDAIDALDKEKETEEPSGRPSGGSAGSSGGSGGGRRPASSGLSFGGNEKEPENNQTQEPSGPKAEPFSDIAGHPWAKDAILNLYHKNILNGKEKGRFAPQDNLTREEAVKLFVCAFGLEEKQEDLTFYDCNVHDWYYPYVSIAVKSGIVKGISKELFGTGINISRQDFAVMLERSLKAAGCKLAPKEAAVYADGETIAEYAAGAVSALSANGIFTGDDTQRFRPSGQITRAEAAVAVERAIQFVEG